MDELQKFKSDLDTLRNKRAVLEAKLSSVQQAAARLRVKMEAMGYKSIGEAVEDYNRRTADLADKQAKVETLIKQIESVDSTIPTREEILAKLRREMTPKEGSQETLSVESLDKIAALSAEAPPVEQPATQVLEEPFVQEDPQSPIADFKFSL